MAFLELLAGPAPARVVAADLLALVDASGLDRRRQRDLAGRHLRRTRHGGRYAAGGRGGQRTRLVLGGPALVLEAGGAARRRAPPPRAAGAARPPPLLSP